MSSQAPTRRRESPEPGAPAEASVRLDNKGGAGRLVFEGDWVVRNALKLDSELDRLKASGVAAFDLSGIGRIDTTGAWLIDRTRHQFEHKGSKVSLEGASQDVEILLDAVHKAE